MNRAALVPDDRPRWATASSSWSAACGGWSRPPTPRHPIDPASAASGFGVQEGQNERETETFDPKTGKWR